MLKPYFDNFGRVELSAKQIADLLKGEVEGSPDTRVNALSKIEESQSGALSFLANQQYTPYLYSTQASVVIVDKKFKLKRPVRSTLIRVDDVYASFAKVSDIYNNIEHDKKGTDSHSFVSESAFIGNNAYIGTFAYVGDDTTIGNNVKIYPNSYIGDNVEISDNTTIYSGVCVHSNCKIGKEATLHSGVIIGGDGFGFAPNSSSYDKVAQIGNVIIEDHVEIGANTTIDRATLGSTIIRKGVKLDNLIQIAHNVEIGENTVIAAQSGIAGSTKIGKNCMIGGQVGIIGHLNIGNNVKIAAQSGIADSLSDNQVVQGSPAFGIKEYKRSYVYFRKLTEIVTELEKLKRQVQSLNNP